MKVKTSIKPICPGCYLVKRKSKIGKLRLYRYCKINERHKARQH